MLEQSLEGGAEIIFLPRPENYEEPKTFPLFEVVEIISGGDSVAPNLGKRYSFQTEEEARRYIVDVYMRGYKKDVALNRFDSKGKGEEIEKFEPSKF